jgi:hypothetical protein
VRRTSESFDRKENRSDASRALRHTQGDRVDPLCFMRTHSFRSWDS